MRSVVAIAALFFATNFEVAAIHPHDPKNPAAMMRFPGREVFITGLAVRNLVWLAWDLPPDRVTGGPKWIDSDLYDIQAKAPAGSSNGMEAQRPRIQALLADRFQLKVHRETKNSPVYLLTVAKNGLKMEEAKGPNPPYNEKASITPWSLFLLDLSRRLGRPVIDKTGLKGAWYIGLRYTADDGTASGMGIRLDRAQADTGPSIFTAVQEQLGLKLDAGTGPVDVLVIDSVARPSLN